MYAVDLVILYLGKRQNPTHGRPFDSRLGTADLIVRDWGGRLHNYNWLSVGVKNAPNSTLCYFICLSTNFDSECQAASMGVE